MVSNPKAFALQGNSQSQVIIIRCVNAFTKLSNVANAAALVIFSMMKIREHGLQAREAQRMVTKRPQCQSGGSFGSVRLSDCYAAGLIFVYGLLISICVFGIEKLIKFKPCNMCVMND